MPQTRVAIIGAGLSGLCLANALLQDAEQRFRVDVYERDSLAYSSDRGGYQIRLGRDGMDGLRSCLSEDDYDDLRHVWGAEMSRAPTIVDSNLNILCDLNTLKLYPKSRAVPRSVLKEYLLRKPMAAGAVHMSKKLKAPIVQEDASGHSTIRCEFMDGTNAIADILIAADGSGSLCNEAFGIKNLTKLNHLSMQARGNISQKTYEKLPEALKKQGALLGLGGDLSFFSATSHAGPNGKSNTDDVFLFWGARLDTDTMTEIKKLPSSEAQCDRLEQELLKRGCSPDGLPVLPRVGRTNVKIGQLGCSKPLDAPVWRNGKQSLGRVIFIGDSIHAMSPGRGQGANQAMKDAAELSKMLLNAPCFGQSEQGAIDIDVWKVANAFDEEMYKRAFAWVKSSETAGEMNVSTWAGYLTVKGVTNAVWVAGLALSMLEKVGLYRFESVEF